MGFLDKWFHIVDAQAGFKAAREAACKVMESLLYVINWFTMSMSNPGNYIEQRTTLSNNTFRITLITMSVLLCYNHTVIIDLFL